MPLLYRLSVLIIIWDDLSKADEAPRRVSECFGGMLRLTCDVRHRIQVLDDVFGRAQDRDGEAVCQHGEGDCTVKNNRYTSVVHRYCEGQQSCQDIHVERRDCGGQHTNYELVIYKCVPDSAIMNICRESSSSGSHTRYITTPNFPSHYPPNLDCKCQLRATTRAGQIQLKLSHFSVQFHSPCKDWAEISLDGHTRRLCGAYSATLRGHALNVTFHSDEHGGHQGLWLEMSAYPKDKTNVVDVQCGSVSSQQQEEATTDENSLDPANIKSARSTMTPVTSSSNADDLNITEHRPLTYFRLSPFLTNEAVTADNSLLPQTNYRTNLPRLSHTAPGTSDENVFSTSYMPAMFIPTCEEYIQRQLGRSNLLYKLCTESIYEEDDDDKGAFLSPRETIIIGACASSVAILVCSLSLAVCFIKSRRAKKKAARRHARIQERLHSLTLYDSIPLSSCTIGRRSPCPILPKVEQDSVAASVSKFNRIPSPHNSNWLCKLRQDAESERDSALYSELGRYPRSDPGFTPTCTPRLPSLSAGFNKDVTVSLCTSHTREPPNEVYTHV